MTAWSSGLRIWWTCCDLFIQSPIVGHLGYYQLFIILDSDVLGRSLCIKVLHLRTTSLGSFPEEEAFLGERVGPVL